MSLKKSLKVKPTKYHSFAAGTLTKGCQQCVKGEKLVLFVTGLCSQRCEFCPISDMKLYKDVIYANERPIHNINNILDEAKISRAKGAGITGGDPLMKVERVAEYITALKNAFGKKFHTHLYTPLNLVNEKNLKILADAGLDEIRFHPELDKKWQWPRILLAKKFRWNVGVEIPALPKREADIKTLIAFINGKIDFLNINELELADNAVWRKAKSVRTKDNISYAIDGSDSLAKRLADHSASLGVRTHYCTCKLKDAVQLATRVKRRAKMASLPTDKKMSDGMLLRGAIYLNELKPGFGYRKALYALSESDKGKILKQLYELKSKFKARLFVDENKLRLLTSEKIVRGISPGEKYARAVVLEYPTFDALELEVEFL